jgi:DNA primase
MAKTYLEIVKYLVESKFTIDGMVDKPDIIGAVFGQTEGLLGNELDLRELQKNGKIGRIEIELTASGNKTFGRLFLPASLDRIETCILAAAVEAVDRVGPYEAAFAVEKIEDTRSEKRRKILLRAKELVKIMLNNELPDSKEIAEMVQSDVRAAEVTSYGAEKLAAGPDIAKSEDIIIVEGRADVLTLLRNDITNGIAVGGATNNIPRSLIQLMQQKEVTVFLDGDRGGDLILRSLMNVGDIDFVARAPDGKEVEDLTRKEIIKAMRSRTPLDMDPAAIKMQKTLNQRQQNQAPMPQNMPRPPQQGGGTPMPSMPPRPPQPQQQAPRSMMAPAPAPVREPAILEMKDDSDDSPIPRIESQSIPRPMMASGEAQAKPALESMLLSQLGGGLDQLTGSLRSRLYDPAGNVIKEIPIRELLVEVQNTPGVYAIVLDGVITQRLVELCVQRGIKAIYGNKANPFQRRERGIILYTKEQGTLE